MIPLPRFMHARHAVDGAFLGAWGAAALALWVGVVQCAIDEREAATQQEAQVEALSDEASQSARQLEVKASQAERLDAQVSKLVLRLRSPGTLNTRLAELTDLADEVGKRPGAVLKVDQITPGTPESGTRYTAVPIRLTGSAGYASAAELLAAVLTFRDTGVAGFSLTHSAEERAPAATFRLDLVWYAAPAGAGEGAP